MDAKRKLRVCVVWPGGNIGCAYSPALAQLIDQTKAPNLADEGINQSLAHQVGAGRGNWMTPDSSSFIIARDPFRSIRRGRQLFQRKFTRDDGQGPVTRDGSGDVNSILAIGAGLSDSCASCHGRPRGSAGAGGDVATRPDSRDAPHLFGLERKCWPTKSRPTCELFDRRRARKQRLKPPNNEATDQQGNKLRIDNGQPNGSINTSNVQGVDADLECAILFITAVRSQLSLVGALNAEMGGRRSTPIS
jgi:hypothetical protein